MFVLLMVPVLYVVLHMFLCGCLHQRGVKFFVPMRWGKKYPRSRISADLFVQAGASIF